VDRRLGRAARAPGHLAQSWDSFLPTAALADGIDDSEEPLRAVQPVRLDGTFCSVTVPLLERLDNYRVLVHHHTKLLHNPTGIEPPISLGLRFDGLEQPAQARPSANIHHGLVKAQVEVKNEVGILSPCQTQLPESFIEFSQLVDDDGPCCQVELRGFPCRQAFQMTDDRIELPSVFLSKGSHGQAFLSAITGG